MYKVLSIIDGEHGEEVYAETWASQGLAERAAEMILREHPDAEVTVKKIELD